MSDGGFPLVGEPLGESEVVGIAVGATDERGLKVPPKVGGPFAGIPRGDNGVDGVGGSGGFGVGRKGRAASRTGRRGRGGWERSFFKKNPGRKKMTVIAEFSVGASGNSSAGGLSKKPLGGRLWRANGIRASQTGRNHPNPPPTSPPRPIPPDPPATTTPHSPPPHATTSPPEPRPAPEPIPVRPPGSSTARSGSCVGHRQYLKCNTPLEPEPPNRNRRIEPDTANGAYDLTPIPGNLRAREVPAVDNPRPQAPRNRGLRLHHHRQRSIARNGGKRSVCPSPPPPTPPRGPTSDRRRTVGPVRPSASRIRLRAGSVAKPSWSARARVPSRSPTALPPESQLLRSARPPNSPPPTVRATNRANGGSRRRVQLAAHRPQLLPHPFLKLRTRHENPLQLPSPNRVHYRHRSDRSDNNANAPNSPRAASRSSDADCRNFRTVL